MREGRPYVLVVGGADTGRAPLLAALLRGELGPSAIVASAGVLGHAGEPADPMVDLALEQAGMVLGSHVARQLDAETIRDADLLLGVDRGSARVATLRTTQQVVAIGELANAEDVPDPHRMPLGVWIAAMREYQAQLAAGLPALRTMLRLDAVSGRPPIMDIPAASAPPAAAARDEHVQRMVRLLETARTLPEIVDWSKLVAEVVERLRMVADLAEGDDDLTPGATLMLAGLLLQTPRMPSDEDAGRLVQLVKELQRPLDDGGLASFARMIA